ncbi:hypothetical protein SEA_DEJAVU_8 [Microbacterium Phage DejaVu]|nr:hypothetical protein SEA_DEJAVU_8 [Microbacterium Phage DejaVu]
MALEAWIDENDNLYVAGEKDAHEAKTASVEDVLYAANKHLEEVGEYKLLRRRDIGRFRTLWVDPEALKEEVWADEEWADVSTVEQDRQYDDMGWVPVLTIEVESI